MDEYNWHKVPEDPDNPNVKLAKRRLDNTDNLTLFEMTRWRMANRRTGCEGNGNYARGYNNE